MAENKHLVPVEKMSVAVLFSEQLDGVLAEIEKQAMSHKVDVTTVSGRDAIKSIAYKVTRSKTYIDEKGKEANAERKKKTDIVNAFRKRARDFLDPLRDRVRKPLDDYEAAQAKIKAEEEAAEKKKIQDRIDALLAVGVNMDYFDVSTMSDDVYVMVIAEKTKAWREEQERIAAEEKAKEEAEAAALIAAEKENERLAEVAKAQKVESDRLEAVRKEQEAKAAELKAAQDKLAAEKRAEQERKDRETFEKLAVETAKYQAEKEADERAIEAEKQAEIEAERKAALLPDKEKLLNWANNYSWNDNPDLDTEEARSIMNRAVEEVELIMQDVINQAKEL